MSGSQPRLRVFAGPNGSGKSTLKEVLPESLLGIYVNADEIEKLIRAEGYLSLTEFSIEAMAVELSNFLAQFDNSGEDKVWLAEVTDGGELEMKTDVAPHWFKAALWDAFEGGDVV